MQCIPEHDLAFLIYGRDGEREASWICKRDQTRGLAKFEQCAIKETQAIFVNVLHSFLFLDDNHFEALAADNQVKMLSSKKADRKSHSADAVEGALFTTFSNKTFWQRREHQMDLVQTLLSDMLDNKYQNALNSCIVTVDCSYGKSDFAGAITTFCVSAPFCNAKSPFPGTHICGCLSTRLVPSRY